MRRSAARWHTLGQRLALQRRHQQRALKDPGGVILLRLLHHFLEAGILFHHLHTARATRRLRAAPRGVRRSRAAEQLTGHRLFAKALSEFFPQCALALYLQARWGVGLGLGSPVCPKPLYLQASGQRANHSVAAMCRNHLQALSLI